MRNSINSPKNGFTLIELSIVLVIIGLLVGGILVGRDLISASQIRATISEIDKIDAAIRTFHLKYGGLPGDLEANKAATFGMETRSGAAGHGDGNGQWEGCSSAAVANNTVFGCETALIWRDLDSANLIEGSFTSATDVLLSVPSGGASAFFPPSKLRSDLYYTVFSYYGYNFLFLANILSTNASGQYSMGSTSGNLSPKEALSIDQKIDEGKPWTGRALGASNSTQVAGTSSAQPNNTCTSCSCLVASPPIATNVMIYNCATGNNCLTNVTYNMKSASYDSRFVCQLLYRFQ